MTVVKINVIEVADGGGAELEHRFAQRIAETDGAEGFLGAELLRPASGSTYFSISRWVSQDAFDAFAGSAAADVRTGEWKGDAATDARLLSFEVVGQHSSSS